MILKYPDSIFGVQHKTKGYFYNQYPIGAVIHYTAGASIESSIQHGKDRSLAFWGISRAGVVHHTHPLDRWGYHCGDSEWKGVHGLSMRTIGIELASAGRLEWRDGSHWTYWGQLVPKARVRCGHDQENAKAGCYEAYTPEQEKTLIKLLLWMKSQKPDVFDFDWVVGHDEVSPDRKQDPGWALSMTMPNFRDLLKEKYSKKGEAK